MQMPKISVSSLQSIPLVQKLALVALVIAVFVGVTYYYFVEPEEAQIAQLTSQIGQLDSEIQTLTIKVKHLDELIAASKQLEIELAKKKEKLPPAEEAVMLLKQLSDLGIRLGLDIKLWKPGPPSEDPSKLFVKMPVNVEVTGGYHTAALFFDRVNHMPRIINVSDLKMADPNVSQGRVVTKTVFDLVAYAAPEEKPASAETARMAAAPGGATAPKPPVPATPAGAK
ncbi:pilus assembly protein PilO [Nitrospira sp.]|nr:pilus assembly protein PilO [Nitrospira sp.]